MNTPESAAVPAAEPFDASADRVFDTLSHEARRFVVAWLVERSVTTTLTTLARELAAWDRDEPVDVVPESTVQSAQRTLYHVHVPKLADTGVLSYDRTDGVVTLDIDAETVRERVPLPDVED